MVELCQQAGLVWGKELIFDATKVRANANIDSLVPRWYAEAKAYIDDLFVGDAATGATVTPRAASLPDCDRPVAARNRVTRSAYGAAEPGDILI